MRNRTCGSIRPRQGRVSFALWISQKMQHRRVRKIRTTRRTFLEPLGFPYRLPDICSCRRAAANDTPSPITETMIRQSSEF